MTQEEFNASITSGAAKVEEPATSDASSAAPAQAASTPPPQAATSIDQFLPVLIALQSTQQYLSAAPTFIPQTFQDQIQFVFDGTNSYLYLYINNTWQKVQLNAPAFSGFSTRVLAQQHANSIGTSLTKVQWTNVPIDNNSEYDSTNWRIKVKNPGVYIVYAQTFISPGSTQTQVTLSVQKNGTEVAGASDFVEANQNQNTPVSTSIMVSMALNDYIELWASRTGNGTMGESNTTEFLYMYRIA
jgi:hypothetical protein